MQKSKLCSLATATTFAPLATPSMMACVPTDEEPPYTTIVLPEGFGSREGYSSAMQPLSCESYRAVAAVSKPSGSTTASLKVAPEGILVVTLASSAV